MANAEIPVLNLEVQESILNKSEEPNKVNRLTALCIKAIQETDTRNYGILNLYLDFMPQDKKTYELLNFLIGRVDIDLNCKDYRLQTPLMKLCGNGFDPSLSLKLIEAGADINSKDDCGFTALIYAVANREREVFEALLKKDNDVSWNMHASLILTLACNLYSSELVEIIMQHKPPTYISISADLQNKPRMSAHVITDKDSNLLYQIYYNFKNRNPCDPNIYEFFWKQENIIFNKSNGQSFLDHYLTHCDYASPDWVNCLKMTLTSKLGPELMQEYKTHSKICINFYKSMMRKPIRNHQRLKLFKMWVSLGPPVKSIEDISNVFNVLGFDEVEGMIYNIGSYFLTTTEIAEHFLLNLICGVNSNFNYEELIGKINIISDDCIFQRQIKFLCKYFTFPVALRHLLLVSRRRFSPETKAIILVNRLTEKYNKAPKFVPMKELCRNACRIYITEYWKPAHPREFYEIINNLPVPTKIKDYIKFKIPDF